MFVSSRYHTYGYTAMAVDGFETRFAVNTIAPYLLTKLLLPLMDGQDRVVNLSSAAQSTVDVSALAKARPMSDNDAYAQSKLAITMWSMAMAEDFDGRSDRPSIIALNPKSFLGSKMVKEAYGMEGHDIRIGGDILMKTALSEAFANASGRYFDNDQGRFANPHPDALDRLKRQEIIKCLEEVLA